MNVPSKLRAVAAPLPEVVPTLIRTAVALVATATLLALFAPNVIHGQTRTPPVTAGSASAGSASAGSSSGATTTGSAAGALAAQTVDKADAAAKSAPKASSSFKPKGGASAVSEKQVGRAHAPVPVPTVATSQDVADEDVTSGGIILAAPGSSGLWGVDLRTQRGARGRDEPTIFLTHIFDEAEADLAVQAVLPSRTPRPRFGEYASAPYVVSTASLLSAGFVGRRNGAGGSFHSASERMLLLDEMEVTLPAGANAEPGSRFVSVDAGTLLKPGAQVAVPTGVLEVVSAEAGRPVIARLVQQSGRVEEGQKLVPLEGGPLTADIRAEPLARGAGAPETDVVWVASDALLPSVQSFLVLGAGASEGVKAGDQFDLVKRMGLGADAQEQRVATVRVVRVTEFGSSAIVLRLDRPGIAIGGAARLVARVP